ncbi:MAG: EamA family transporter [Acidimicrobiales bacterium]
MTAVLLATLAALSYGASDFTGALASKETEPALVTVAMQVVSLAALVVMVLIFPPAERTMVDLAWGGLAGLGAAFGLTTFYRALALGPMSTAAALTALVSAALPVMAGLALGDEVPAITLVGISIAVPAAVLVSAAGSGMHGASNTTPRERVVARRDQNRTRALSVAAGVGFAVFFVALSRTSEDAGLYPLLGARVASIAALSLTLTLSHRWAPIARHLWPIIIVTGLLDFAANSLYLLAVREGSLTWVAAISSLYPISTVLLARIVLGERLTRVQIAGFSMAGVALALVAIGA